MDDGTVPEDRPPTDDELAALHAGLLDDETAARLRRRVRDCPDAEFTMARLDDVCRRLAEFADSPAAPVPTEVSDRIGAALRFAPRRPWLRTIGLLLVLSTAAAAVAIEVSAR